MISKGTTHNNGARLAAYMTTGKEGERAELWQLRGFAATNIKDAFRDVQIMSGATKCEQPLFHVQVRNRDGETLTRQQWEHAADRIERMLGLTGQPRAIAFHIDEKTGHEHMHIAFSRIDENSLKAIPLPFFKERLKKISRELEAHFALEPVTNQRDGNIKFAPTRAEHEQARRLGLDPHELRNTIRECWDRADCGRSFQAALEYEGFTLAQGERRDFVVIDRAGGMHVLGKRILDMTASKIRDRMSDISRDELPTVAMARSLAPEFQIEKPKQQKQAPTWDRDLHDREWQDAVITAAIDKERIERKFAEAQDRVRGAGAGSRKQQEWPIYPPVPEPITTSPLFHFEDAAKVTAKRRLKPVVERASGPVEPTRPTASEKINGREHSAVPTIAKKIDRSVRVGKSATRAIGKTLDIASDAFASLFAPTFTPEQIREGEMATLKRQAEAESEINFSRYTAEIAAQRQRQEDERAEERRRNRNGGGRER